MLLMESEISFRVAVLGFVAERSDGTPSSRVPDEEFVPMFSVIPVLSYLSSGLHAWE